LARGGCGYLTRNVTGVTSRLGAVPPATHIDWTLVVAFGALAISLYGAVLSTYTALYKDKPKCGFDVRTADGKTVRVFPESHDGVFAAVFNRGSVPLYVSDIRLRVGKKTWSITSDIGSFTLAPNEPRRFALDRAFFEMVRRDCLQEATLPAGRATRWMNLMRASYQETRVHNARAWEAHGINLGVHAAFIIEFADGEQVKMFRNTRGPRWSFYNGIEAFLIRFKPLALSTETEGAG
jgi:hypothetical protein